MSNLKIEKVKQELEKRNYNLIELIKNGDSRQIVFLDDDGYKYKTSWENFKKSKNFKQVTYSNPFSIENIKLYLKINNIPIGLISTEFSSVLDKMEFKMKCGHAYKISWHGLSKLKAYDCPECSRIEYGIKRRVSYDKVKKIFDKNNLKIMGKYELVNIPVDCIDKEGYKGRITYSGLKQGKDFSRFSPNNFYTIENIKNWIDLNNLDISIISKEYKNDKENMKWECKCGNYFYKSWENIHSKKGLSCEKCFNKSKNEEICMNFLKEKNISFLREYKFEDCKYKRPLLFDFYIPDLSRCIEVDGEQHYSPTKFKGTSEDKAIKAFDLQKKKDKIKDEYCIKNNIGLLRIPYWDFKKNEYKNKISQYLGIAT